jgi:hypothetical protein
MFLYVCNSAWVVKCTADVSLLDPLLPIQVQPWPEDQGPEMTVLPTALKKFNELSYQETILWLEEEARGANYNSSSKIKLSKFDHRGRLALALEACERPDFPVVLSRIKAFREERRRLHPHAYCNCHRRVVVISLGLP